MKVKMSVQAVVEIEVPSEDEIFRALEQDDSDSIEWLMYDLEKALDDETAKITINHVGRTWGEPEYPQSICYFSDLDYDF